MCCLHSQESYLGFFIKLYVEFRSSTSITIKGSGLPRTETSQEKHKPLLPARKSTDGDHEENYGDGCDDDDDDKVGKIYLRAKWLIRPELIPVSVA